MNIVKEFENHRKQIFQRQAALFKIGHLYLFTSPTYLAFSGNMLPPPKNDQVLVQYVEFKKKKYCFHYIAVDCPLLRTIIDLEDHFFEYYAEPEPRKQQSWVLKREINIKDLPLYITWHTLPLFEELLKNA